MLSFKEFVIKRDTDRFTEANLYQGTGILHYRGTDKVSLEIDPEIVNYYRTLIPKWIDYNKQAYKPHITVVRTGKEVPTNMEAWGKYEGKEIPFQYENHVYYKEPYFFLKAYSEQLEKIREELGLPRIRTGFSNFHITIANTKNI